MTRVVGYIRVSTAGQVDRESLTIQERNIRRYCAQRDMELVEILVEEGVSAAKHQLRNRPAGRTLYDFLRQPGIDGVVVPALDRMFRNTLEGLLFVERFGRRNSVAIYSLQEQIDTSTAHGRHVFTILLANAQLESDRLSDRATVVTHGLLEQGRQWGGIPYGCIGVTESEDKDAAVRLYRDPATWPIRVRIVSEYIDGKTSSLRQIAKRLEEEKVPTPGGGKHWHAQSVKRIVDNHHHLVEHIPALPAKHEAKVSGAHA